MFTFRKIEDKSFWFLRCCEIIKKFQKRGIKISSVLKITGHLGIGLNNDTQFLILDNVSKSHIETVIKNRPNIIDDVINEILLDQNGNRKNNSDKKGRKVGEKKKKQFSKFINKLFRKGTKEKKPTKKEKQYQDGSYDVSDSVVQYPFSEIFGIAQKESKSFLNVFFIEDEENLEFCTVEKCGCVNIWIYNTEYLSWIHCGCKNLLGSEQADIIEVSEVGIESVIYIKKYKIFLVGMNNGEIFYRELEKIRIQKRLAQKKNIIIDISSFNFSKKIKFLCNIFVGKSQKRIRLEYSFTESKNGVWVFSTNYIHHLSLNNFPFSVPLSYISCISVQKFEASNQSAFYYLNKYVHPVSRELLLLGIDGLLYVLKISNENKTLSLLKRVTKKPLSILLEYVSFFKFCLEKKKVVFNDLLKFKPVEFFFVYNNIFCVRKYKKLYIYEVKSNVLLYEVLIPNEIAIQESNSNLVNSKKSVMWKVPYGSSTVIDKIGFFSENKLYLFCCPSINKLMDFIPKKLKEDFHLSLKKTVKDGENSENNEKRQYIDVIFNLALIASEWKLNGWQTLFLLEIIFNDNCIEYFANKQKEKEEIFRVLLEKLENPCLVWNETNSLSEQKMILDRLCEFIRNFPRPDNKFWKRNRRHNNVSWEEFYKKDEKSENIEEVYENLTELNLSVVPFLAKSVFLSKESLNQLEEFPKKEKPEITLDESKFSELKQLSDFQLIELLQNNKIKSTDDFDFLFNYLSNLLGVKFLVKCYKEVVVFEVNNNNCDDIFNLKQAAMTIDGSEMSEVLMNDEILFLKPSLISQKIFNLGEDEMEKNPALNLHFEILCSMLYQTKPYLICLLILIIRKEKRLQNEKEKERENEKIREQKNKFEKFKFKLECSKNYSRIYSQRVYDYLAENFTLVEKKNKFQVYVLVQLLYWSGEVIKCIEILFENNFFDLGCFMIKTHYKKPNENDNGENLIFNNELIYLVLKYCGIKKEPSLWKLLSEIIPKKMNIFQLFELLKSKMEKENENEIFVSKNQNQKISLNTLQNVLHNFL